MINFLEERYVDENGTEQRLIGGYERYGKIIGISQDRRIWEKQDSGRWILSKDPKIIYSVGLPLMPARSLDVIDGSKEPSIEEYLERLCQRQGMNSQEWSEVKEEIQRRELEYQVERKNKKDRYEIEQNILPGLFYEFGGRRIIRRILKEEGDFFTAMFKKLNEEDETYQCPYEPGQFRVRQFLEKPYGKRMKRMVQVTMPDPGLRYVDPPQCVRLYFCYDAVFGKKHYITIERSRCHTMICARNADKYAELDFSECKVIGCLDEMTDADLDNTLVDMLSDSLDATYHYFMVALDDDGHNKRLAERLAYVTEELMDIDNRSVHYICAGTEGDDSGLAQPVYVDGVKNISDISPELERMAFNAHLSWLDSINGDAKKELERFRNDEYDYGSSVSFAMSIKYKLADLGISMDDTDMAAEKFWALIQSKESAETLSRLNVLEHRRWVIEKIVQDWEGIRKETEDTFYEDCYQRCVVRNEEKKIHPCIVRSGLSTPLSTGIYSRDRKYWDMKSEHDDNLDDLDRVSTGLHRKMRAKAEAFKQKEPLDTATGDNKMQEDRGRLMGVITISEVEDIEDIAAHLLKLV